MFSAFKDPLLDTGLSPVYLELCTSTSIWHDFSECLPIVSLVFFFAFRMAMASTLIVLFHVSSSYLAWNIFQFCCFKPIYFFSYLMFIVCLFINVLQVLQSQWIVEEHISQNTLSFVKYTGKKYLFYKR